VLSALLATVFLPFFTPTLPVLGFILFVVKTLLIVFLLTAMRSVLARLRIDQMVNFCWRYLTPLAMLQVLINLILKGVLPL
jgi:NADH-quinone oxidoreductase subunit H